MTQELELSIQARSADLIQSLLDEFEAQHHIRVKLRVSSWDTAWSDLVKVALYSDGPDVSEIGTTWLGDLVAMNALHDFHPDEISLLGKPARFLPAAWQGCHITDQPETWAIPWFVGVRLVLYRRRLLHAARVDEGTAFRTTESFENTLSGLHESGVRVPWTVPTGHTHTTLLNVCSWVWSAGGDFITPDGTHVLFNQPAACAGLRGYFALSRFIPPAVRRLNGLQPDDQFLADDHTAVTITGPWLFDRVTPALRDEIGVAMPMGLPFLGGSHLVVWKHTRRHDAAMKLIHFLTQTPAQVTYSQRIGLLPAVIEAFAFPPFQTDRLWKSVVDGLKGGRTFPVTRSWGLMEDRLSTEFAGLWDEVLNSPQLDLDAAIARRLEPLARRLDLVLGQT